MPFFRTGLRKIEPSIVIALEKEIPFFSWNSLYDNKKFYYADSKRLSTHSKNIAKDWALHRSVAKCEFSSHQQNISWKRFALWISIYWMRWLHVIFAKKVRENFCNFHTVHNKRLTLYSWTVLLGIVIASYLYQKLATFL